MTCDTAAGFQLYKACGAAACLLKTFDIIYFGAVAFCDMKTAIIYHPDTYERFTLLHLVAGNNLTWAGFYSASGIWRWQNRGSAMTAKFHEFMWNPGEAEIPGEQCARFRAPKLDDVYCCKVMYIQVQGFYQTS